MPKRAFTLVEILVVVVLLGILAAIVIPTVASNTIAAKQSALASNLGLLRRLVLVYKCQHLEVGPGYPDGDVTQVPAEQSFVEQATMASNARGLTAAIGTPGFARGPYMQMIPVNPFNGKSTIEMVGNDESFPSEADDSHGWIYKAATCETRPDNTGTDGSGKRYYDY